MKVNILAIHAHPDDLEILAGGTLTHLSRQGHRITLVTMTPGDCGSAEYDADTIANMRRNEAKAASQVLGEITFAPNFATSPFSMTILRVGVSPN